MKKKPSYESGLERIPPPSPLSHELLNSLRKLFNEMFTLPFAPDGTIYHHYNLDVRFTN